MLGLSEVVRDLRAELYEALQAGEDERLRFELGDIDLELRVTVAKEGGGGAKVRFYVVEVGGDGKVSSESGHTIRLKLSPHWEGGGRPWISGRGAQGEGIGPDGG